MSALALLWWARALLAPMGMAVFLAFVLAPLVVRLQRTGLNKVVSVLTVVALTGGLLLGTLYLSARQVTSLAAELPNYSNILQEKVRSARGALSSRTMDRLQAMSESLARAWRQAEPGAAPAAPTKEPAPTVAEPGPDWTGNAQSLMGVFLSFLGQAALASILVVFILLNREDLRDRLILLAGHSRITVTTKAIDEAGRRISRFLLMQAIVNTTYGMALTLGLWLFGLPYALLWGFLAATLRYIPYVGPWVGAILPVTLAVAVFPSWGASLGIVALIAVLELISNNVVEPLLYGRSVGLSPTAVLISAAVWGFLWGPVGMVLSTPIAVCLVVLGKHIPGLRVLPILLSDEAALDPRLRWYQRALAQDDDEAAEVIAEQLKGRAPGEVIDDVLLPALAQANADHRANLVEPRDYDAILRAAHETAELLAEGVTAQAEDAAPTDVEVKPLILAIAVRDKAETTALTLIEPLIPADKWQWRVAPSTLLISELIAEIQESKPSVLILSSLPPGRGLHARYLCKRLAQQAGEARILVARWSDADPQKQIFVEAGAHDVAGSAADVLAALARWRPVALSTAQADSSAAA